MVCRHIRSLLGKGLPQFPRRVVQVGTGGLLPAGHWLVYEEPREARDSWWVVL